MDNSISFQDEPMFGCSSVADSGGRGLEIQYTGAGDPSYIYIWRIAHFEPKAEETQSMIDLASEALDVLRSFKKRAASVNLYRNNNYLIQMQPTTIITAIACGDDSMRDRVLEAFDSRKAIAPAERKCFIDRVNARYRGSPPAARAPRYSDGFG